jgi:anaphase-promoting complex subunit 1
LNDQKNISRYCPFQVAAGLRLAACPDSQDIDSTWIAFNQPPGPAAAGGGTPAEAATAETEHAGLIMALGLTGHLGKLSKLDSFEYLMKGSEPISIGLLLGVAATHLATMDVLVTKKLATQLEALLPPSATELPLSPNTQVEWSGMIFYIFFKNNFVCTGRVPDPTSLFLPTSFWM